MTNEGPVVGGLWQGEYLLQASLGDPTQEVFRAQRRSDSQTVAIRFWRSPNEAMSAQFVEFARGALALRHPALAQAEAAGREGHYCFLASEYVVGQKLDTWADQVGIPPLGEVIDLMRRLCEGLAVAARSGVHHSALHPRNVVMLQGSDSPNRRRAQPKLLDLGWPTFARPRAPHALAAQFMPPEQLASVLEPSQPPLPMTTASMNVYSCGALLYYLCTGGPPYRHAELAMLRDAQLQGRLVLPSRINPQITASLNTVIIQALSLDPKARFASVAELAEALVRVSLTPSVANARPVLSSVPPRSGSVPPRAAGPSRASAVGLKRISAPAISIPPGFPTRPPPAATEFTAEEAETGRLSAITHRPPANAQQEEYSEQRDRNSAPAGSFSSHPPPSAAVAPKRVRGVVAAPLALFSGAPQERSGADSGASPSRLVLGPGQILAQDELMTARPPRGGKRQPLLWIGAVSVVAASALIGFIRLRNSGLLATVDQTPTVTVVRPSATRAPVPPESIAEAPAAAPPEDPEYAAGEEEPEPEPEADEAVPSADFEARPQRSRNARTSATGASPPSRETREPSSPPVEVAARERRDTDAAPARSDEGPAAGLAPAPSPPIPEAPARAAEAAPQAAKSARAEPVVDSLPPPAPLPAPPVPASRPAPEPEVRLPLEAKSSIGEITLRGALPTSWVKRAVERLVPQFTSCYGRAAHAAGKNQFGWVLVEVELDERGRARSPRARGGKLPGLNECVAEAASRVISERAPDTGTVHASFKVSFSP